MSNEKHKEPKKKENPLEIDNKEKLLPNEEVKEAEKKEAQAQITEEDAKIETVTIPLKEYAAQMEKIDQLQSKVSEVTDGLQRERADFTNYRNRINRDRDLSRQNLTADMVQKYLAVNDDIDRALKNAPNNEEVNGWMEGIRLISQKLQNILQSEGVQRIPAENETFDPHRHEAIAIEENPKFESGRVIEVIDQGYIIGDRVIRPARVKIAK